MKKEYRLYRQMDSFVLSDGMATVCQFYMSPTLHTPVVSKIHREMSFTINEIEHIHFVLKGFTTLLETMRPFCFLILSKPDGYDSLTCKCKTRWPTTFCPDCGKLAKDMK